MESTKRPMGNATGVNWAMTSSMPNSTVRIRIRTFTSHVSQTRFSKADCIVPLLACGGAAGDWFCLPPVRLLAGQLGNHREQRQIQRNYDSADRDAEHADDDRLEHGQHVPGGVIHFV